METDDGLSVDSLASVIDTDYQKCDFFQFYRLLRLRARGASIEFVAVNHLHFSTSDIRSVKWDELRAIWSVETSAFGLFSDSAYLPTSFSEILEPYGRFQRQAVTQFLTYFDTRLGKLFFDSRSQFDPTLYDFPKKSSWLDAVSSLASRAEQVEDQRTSGIRELGWSESIGRTNRSVSAFEWVCQKSIEAPITVRSFVGGYLATGRALQFGLDGKSFDRVLGKRIWLQDSYLLFEVRDLEIHDVLRFGNYGDLSERIRLIASAFFGKLPMIGFQLTLREGAEITDEFSLGSGNFSLGYTSFLAGRGFDARPIKVYGMREEQ